MLWRVDRVGTTVGCSSIAWVGLLLACLDLVLVVIQDPLTGLLLDTVMGRGRLGGFVDIDALDAPSLDDHAS